MADCKYLVARANLHNLREQVSEFLCDIDTRINNIGGGGVPEAPIDGIIYGRGDAAWKPVYGRDEIDGKIEWIVEQDDRNCAWGERVRFDTPPNEAYLPAPDQDVTGATLLNDILLWNDSNIADQDILVVPFPGTFFTFNGSNYEIDEALTLSPGEIGRVVTRVTGQSYAFAVEAAAAFSGADSFGFVINNDGIERLRYLADDGTWQDLVQIPVGGIQFPYIFSTETSFTDPGAGYVRIDNIDPSLAESVIVSLTNNNGNNTILWISNLDTGDYVAIVDEGNGLGYYYRVLYPPSLVGDVWAVIDVELAVIDGLIADDAPVQLALVGNPANRLPAGGNENDVLAKASGADFSFYWRDIDSTFALDNVPQDGWSYARYWDGSALEWNTGRINPAKFHRLHANPSNTVPVGSEGSSFALVVANDPGAAVIGIQGGANTNSQIGFGQIDISPWLAGIALRLDTNLFEVWTTAMELTFADPDAAQAKASFTRGWLGINHPIDVTLSNVKAPLHVNGGAIFGDATFSPDPLYENSIEVRSINNATAYPVCVLRNQGDTSYDIDSLLGSFQFYSDDTSSSLQGIKASINAYRSDTFGARTGLTFCVTNTENNRERMRLTNLGSLGIGTTAPQGKLDVRSTTEDASTFIARTDLQGIKMWGDANGNYIKAIAQSAKRLEISEWSGGAITFGTGLGVGTERMRIEPSGNVGINVPSPQYRLDVNGGAVNESARFATENTVADIFFESASGLTKIRSASGAMQFDVNGQSAFATALYLTPTAKTRIGSNAAAAFDAMCTVRDPNGFGNNIGDVSNCFEMVAQSNNGTANAVNFLMGYERISDAWTTWSGVKQFLNFSVGTNVATTGGIGYTRPNTSTGTGYMTFHVANNSEKVRIDQGGRLMVGTATPAGVAGSINIAAGANYHINGIPISTFIDAPSDGNLYARKDAAWSSIGSGAGTVSDLSMTQGAVNSVINNTGGTDATILAATTLASGVMTAADKLKLDGIDPDANDYVHPAFTARNLDIDTGVLTGAFVISDLDFNVVSNTIGSVTAASGSFSVRELTLLDIGYTGDPNANDYVHPSYTPRTSSVDSGALTGATVISDIDMNLSSDSEGHVTSSGMTISTRNLTPQDIGAAPVGSAPAIFAFTPTFVGASGGSISGKVYLSVANEMVTVTGQIRWTTPPTGSAQVRVTVAAVPCSQRTGFGFSGNGVQNQRNAANGMNCSMEVGNAYFAVWGYNENGVRAATTYNDMVTGGLIDINFTYYAGSLIGAIDD
jgi:hypothetical protein